MAGFNHRKELEVKEGEYLRPYAAKSRGAKRKYSEPEDEYRTSFQRDRDRVIYSSAFRRLQYKTQVFVVHEGDFYRTRLTHTLEVMQHARTLARVLRVNEDLVEAISLAHDLGHPPFGHAGELELKEIMKDFGGFDHNLQSLRIVDELEKRYPDFPGLNLCWETREGLARHHTAFDNPRLPEEFQKYPQPGIEVQIVNISDELAFCAHDLDDALRVGILTEEQLMESENKIWRRMFERAKKEESSDRELRRKRAVRHLIEYLNVDVINQTEKNIQEKRVNSPEEVKCLDEPLVNFSPGQKSEFENLRNFLRNKVYNNPVVLMMTEKGRKILRNLFLVYVKDPRLLPRGFQEKIISQGDEKTKYQVICDYISGMTDRFAMDTYQMMFEPYEKVLMSFDRR